MKLLKPYYKSCRFGKGFEEYLFKTPHNLTGLSSVYEEDIQFVVTYSYDTRECWFPHSRRVVGYFQPKGAERPPTFLLGPSSITWKFRTKGVTIKRQLKETIFSILKQIDKEVGYGKE